ncbi:WD repeat-containing protein 55 [Dendrobium catenatum]|uniref:WD repeat-containing protein 55 n=1 Tax=Dendrobium catenatum TaxID=906689 RepID=A0A2I0VH20_9ASPA|nr:WD repeat-containing protein 55 [Dendrobium catenatum]XP_020699514.1 WD repeat-containing protein 55 [Dendrobium catenatum]XP_020699519.1 WD repeat-containing protein 55 [Dendrobium catenatum]PKU62710.1 Coatomer subunit beta'-2 [Dendrobium catenatum]
MEINLGKLPFDLDFHPSSPLVAAALISGDLYLYRYGADSQPERLLQVSAHEESCRAVRFVDSGRAVLTASPDCSILATDVETGRAIARLEEAHENSINRLVNLTETTIASGDDEGCIKVWDTRHRSCCNSFDAHEDFVSDMTFVSGTKQLLATSGDGSLSVCSLRKNKVQARSEFSEDELLSLVIMKGGKKVVCGSQNGPLLLYSWGHFEDCSDRLLGHPMSVDTLLKLDEDTLISGSEDGVIRLVGILPNRIIQPLAEHSEYPIEGLAFSYDRKFLGSISHDQMLKLWDVEELLNNNQTEPNIKQVEADSEDSDDMDMDLIPCQPAKGSTRMDGNSRYSTANFFADL